MEPEHANLYNKRGIAFYEMGDYDRALDDYQKAIELNSQYAEAHFNIGLILSVRGELNNALEHFEKSAEQGYKRGAEHATQIRQQLENKSNRE